VIQDLGVQIPKEYEERYWYWWSHRGQGNPVEHAIKVRGIQQRQRKRRNRKKS
jgi:hypothetical protein